MISRGSNFEAFIERVASAARLGGASELDLATLRAIVIDRRDPETIDLARRVQELEKKLAAMPSGERRAAICERLGIGKSHYFDLRTIPVPERTDAG